MSILWPFVYGYWFVTPEAIVSILGGVDGVQYIAYAIMAVGFFRALVSITSTLSVGLTARYFELKYLHSVMQADLLNGRYDIRSAADRYASAVFPVYSVMNRTVAGANGGGLAVCLYVMGVAAVYAAQGLFLAGASIFKLVWLFFIMMSLFILPFHLMGIALCTGVSEDFVAWCNTELRQVILRGGLTAEKNAAAKAAFASELFGTSPQAFLPEILGLPAAQLAGEMDFQASAREGCDSPGGPGGLEPSTTAGDVSPLVPLDGGSTGFSSSGRGDDSNPMARQLSSGNPSSGPGAVFAGASPQGIAAHRATIPSSSSGAAPVASGRDRSVGSSGRGRSLPLVPEHGSHSIDDSAPHQAGHTPQLSVGNIHASERLFGSGPLSTVDETGWERESSRSIRSSARSAAIAYSAARGQHFSSVDIHRLSPRNNNYGIIWGGSAPGDAAGSSPGGAAAGAGASAPSLPYGGGLLYDAVHDIEFARYSLREGVGTLFRPASMVSMGGVAVEHPGLRDRRRGGGMRGLSPPGDEGVSDSDGDNEQLIAGQHPSEFFDSDDEEGGRGGLACCRTNVPADGRAYRKAARTASQIALQSASASRRCCPDLSTTRLLYKGQRRGTRMLFHFADMLKNVQLVRFTDGSMLATVQSTLAKNNDSVPVVMPAPPQPPTAQQDAESPRDHLTMPNRGNAAGGLNELAARAASAASAKGKSALLPLPKRFMSSSRPSTVSRLGPTSAWDGTNAAVRTDFDSDSTVSAPWRPVLLAQGQEGKVRGDAAVQVKLAARKETAAGSTQLGGDPLVPLSVTIEGTEPGGAAHTLEHPHQLLSSEKSISPAGSIAQRVTALGQHNSSGSLVSGAGEQTRGFSPPRHAGDKHLSTVHVAAARTHSPQAGLQSATWVSTAAAASQAQETDASHATRRGGISLAERDRRASATFAREANGRHAARAADLSADTVSDVGGTLRFSSGTRSLDADGVSESGKPDGPPSTTRMGTMDFGGGSFSTHERGAAAGLSDSDADLERVIGTRIITAAAMGEARHTSEDSRAHDHSSADVTSGAGSGPGKSASPPARILQSRQKVNVQPGGPVTIQAEGTGERQASSSASPHQLHSSGSDGVSEDTGDAPVALSSARAGSADSRSVLAAARDDSDTRMSQAFLQRSSQHPPGLPSQQPSSTTLGGQSDAANGSAVPYRRPTVTPAHSLNMGSSSLNLQPMNSGRSSTRGSSSDAAAAAAALASTGGMRALQRKASAYGGTGQSSGGTALPSMFYGYTGGGAAGGVRRQVAWAAPTVASGSTGEDSRDGSIHYIESPSDVAGSTGNSAFLPQRNSALSRLNGNGSLGHFGYNAPAAMMVSRGSGNASGETAAAQLLGEDLEHALVDRQLAQLDSFIRFMQLAQQRGEATGTAFAGPLNVGGAMSLVGLCVSGIVIIINQGFSLYEEF